MLKGTLRGTDEYLYPLVGVWLVRFIFLQPRRDNRS